MFPRLHHILSARFMWEKWLKQHGIHGNMDEIDRFFSNLAGTWVRPERCE